MTRKDRSIAVSVKVKIASGLRIFYVSFLVTVRVRGLRIANARVVLICTVNSRSVRAINHDVLHDNVRNNSALHQDNLMAMRRVSKLSSFQASNNTVGFYVRVVRAIKRYHRFVLMTSRANARFPIPILNNGRVTIRDRVRALVLREATIRPIIFRANRRTGLVMDRRVINPALRRVRFRVRAIIRRVNVRTRIRATNNLPLRFHVASVTRGRAINLSLRDSNLRMNAYHVGVSAIISTRVMARDRLNVVSAKCIGPVFVTRGPANLSAKRCTPSRSNGLGTFLNFLARA